VEVSLIELVERDHVDNVGSHEGVATDGIYLYTSNTHRLYKRKMDGELISSRDNRKLEGTPMAQINSIHIYDGKLYLGSSTWDTEPKLGYIKVFDPGHGKIQALLCEQKKNPTDVTDPKPEFSAIYHYVDVLSYIEEHRVLDYWCDGCAYHDGYFWVVYSDYRYVSKYDINWNHIADYQLTYSVTGVASIIGYQGIAWKGDDIFCPIHEFATPSPCVDRYHWTGSGFSEVARVAAPAQATQGICYLASNDRFYIAQRNHPVVGQYSVTITELIE